MEVVLRVRRTAVFLLLSKLYRLEYYGNDVYEETTHHGSRRGLLCNQSWHRSGITIIDVPRIWAPASFVRPKAEGAASLC